MVAALLDELHHEVVVRDPELAKTAEPGPRIHQETEQHPALRIQNLVTRKLRRIGLIDRGHQFWAHAREAVGTSVVIINNPSCGRCGWVDNMVWIDAVAFARNFARVVVEGEVAAFNIREVRY